MRKKHDVASKAVFVLLTLFASSCTNETMPGGDAPLPTGKYPLEFTSQMYVTRATSADNWDGGEQIALKIGTDVKTYVVSDKTTGAITSTAPFYWTNTGETKTVSAYYPYALATATTLTIKENQSTAVNYQASDALYAPATTFAFTAETKSLTFRHLPARVVANLKAGDGVTTTDVQNATVTFVSQSLSASFDNTTGAVTAASTGSATVIPNAIATASDYQKSVQALLVPCQMKDKQFIAVTLGSDTFYYTPTTTTDGNLESGKGYIYAITVKRDGIEVKLTESDTWTDGGSENVQSLPLMAFTIDLTSYSTNKTYTLPFKTSGSTEAYTLTVDWGDGSPATTINSNTSLSSTAPADLTHTYSAAKEYTITIITAQTDFSKEQIPGFRPGNYRNTNNNPQKLKSLLTPLLNTGESNFASCFFRCSNLTGPIPEDLFVNNKQATSFASCFYLCSKLSGSIPAGLFTANKLVDDFDSCFTNCSELSGEIPAGLFATNTQVTNFNSCFMNCTKLSGSIPEGLFVENTQVTNFTNCFSGCSKLSGSIPASLFATNMRVAIFNFCFRNCTELSGEIPAGLFTANKLVTNFASCFTGCTKLTMNANIFCNEDTEKTIRFLDKRVDFTRCFENVGSHESVSDNAGTAPALWDYSYGTGAPTKVRCFVGIGTVTNANDIPDAWKQ